MYTNSASCPAYNHFFAFTAVAAGKALPEPCSGRVTLQRKAGGRTPSGCMCGRQTQQRSSCTAATDTARWVAGMQEGDTVHRSAPVLQWRCRGAQGASRTVMMHRHDAMNKLQLANAHALFGECNQRRADFQFEKRMFLLHAGEAGPSRKAWSVWAAPWARHCPGCTPMHPHEATFGLRWSFARNQGP